MKLNKDQVEDTEIQDETEEDDDAAPEVVEEDDDPGKGLEGFHKTNILSLMTHQLGSLEKGEMIKLYHQMMETIGKEAAPIPDGSAAKNRASLNMHPSAAEGKIGGDQGSGLGSSLRESIKEDLATVFGDNKQLSEEFKERMTTLFEAAVSARLTLIEAEFEDAHEVAINEEVEEIAEGLLEKVDEYLNYVCAEWMKENEVAIESTLRHEITEEFMGRLKDLFQESYIDVPDERADVVEVLAAKVEELEALLNETIAENMKLSEGLKDATKGSVVDSVAEGLTEIQAAKFCQLAEGIEFLGDTEDYTKKLNVIKEAHFTNPGNQKKRARNTELIVEEITHDPNEAEPPRAVRPEMRGHLAALKRTIRH